MAADSNELAARQRYAADAMWSAVHNAVVSMSRGKADPDHPYSWDDPDAFALYAQLNQALLAANQAGLGQDRFFEATCATCLHCKSHGSDRADQAPVDLLEKAGAAPVMTKEDAERLRVGICVANPPMRVHAPLNGKVPAASFFPRVHQDWVCGNWTPLGTRRGKL